MQEKYKDISLASVIFDKFSISCSFVSNSGYWKSLFLSQMQAIYINPRPGGGLSHLRHGGGGPKWPPPL